MLDNLDQYCRNFLKTVQLKSDFIINQINTSYKENKNKDELAEKHREQISDFLYEYEGTFVGLINKNTNEVLGLDEKCSTKLKEIINKLKNYITDLKE